MLPTNAPSIRTWALRLPPASTTAMSIGCPISLAFCSAAAMTCRASSSVMVSLVFAASIPFLLSLRCLLRAVPARSSRCALCPRLPGGPEHPDVLRRRLLDPLTHVGEQRRRVVLAGVLVQELAVGLHKGDPDRGGDVHLGAAAGDEVPELSLLEACAPVQHHRDGLPLQDLRDPLGLEVRLARVHAVGGPDSGGEAVDAGLLDEVYGELDGVDERLLVGAHVVLDAGYALDLTLHLRPVPLGLGHNLAGLAGVLLDVKVRPVEEHGVPAGLEAGRDPPPVGAVVEVQRHWDGNLLGH